MSYATTNSCHTMQFVNNWGYMDIQIIKDKDVMQIKQLLLRKQRTTKDVTRSVKEIIKNVQNNGDVALLKYAKELDNATINNLKVSEEEIQYAIKNTQPNFLNILKKARDNIYDYHINQKRQGYWITDTPGIMLGQKITPINSIGIYVPSGKATYPSSVLMGVVPAVIAGVENIAITTPPQHDGTVNSDIIVAANVSGVHNIYKVGGAQAIAALAYGTNTISKVDKIIGPGNIYVATAKKLVYGSVDIDSIAGPSEVLVIADETSLPKNIAADMIAQAEHDEMSQAILITTSPHIAQATQKELNLQLNTLPKADIAKKALKETSAIIITEDIVKACEISNAIAPEHLEIMTNEPLALLPYITNAGSIFLGHYSPEALGDYFAGTNHILPTMGTARFSSGVSVDDFVKKSSVLYYDKTALEKVSDDIATFARKEGLEGHARSIEIRLRKP